MVGYGQPGGGYWNFIGSVTQSTNQDAGGSVAKGHGTVPGGGGGGPSGGNGTNSPNSQIGSKGVFWCTQTGGFSSLRW